MTIPPKIILLYCLFILIAFGFSNCNHAETLPDQNDSTVMNKSLNHLSDETSPYLLQHVHNPVDWYPWGEKALAKAQAENKLLIISIGYSACHWCHVMEHESFEDEEVAKLMNDHFVSIKVDREERPDIDQIYMSAVQLMNQRGGWPLNCFALPDGKPFFGGTYFPKNQWMEILQKVDQEYRNNPEKVREFAERLTKGIQTSELITYNTDPPSFSLSHLDELVAEWSKRFDNKEGGGRGAPKFPIPNNYQFLLRYGKLTNNTDVLDHVFLTLNKMAFGGIYDHIGGGFARYSTDAIWKVPHFEKMLYDNAQLVSLYSEAYQIDKDPLYKKVVYETLEFVEREMMSEDYSFYSALDADSEGEEGRFYVWDKEELKSLLGNDYDIFSEYYNVNSNGLWEGNYILLRTKTDQKIATQVSLSIDELDEKVESWKDLLITHRAKRIRPGLDDKCLTSWNGLMLKAFAQAYGVFNQQEFLSIALKNGKYIEEQLIKPDGGLYHSYKEGQVKLNGYLEDYAFVIEGFIALYEVTFDESWLMFSKDLMDYVISNFFDNKSGMFYFTSDKDPPLVARKMEINDNVIPASSSSIAKSLFLLGNYFYNDDYLSKSETMLNNVSGHMKSYPGGYSNWAMLMLNHVVPFYEIAIIGEDAITLQTELNKEHLGNKLYVGAFKESRLPLLKNKYVEGETMIYVCVNKSCRLPVSKVSDAIEQINSIQ